MHVFAREILICWKNCFFDTTGNRRTQEIIEFEPFSLLSRVFKQHFYLSITPARAPTSALTFGVTRRWHIWTTSQKKKKEMRFTDNILFSRCRSVVVVFSRNPTHTRLIALISFNFAVGVERLRREREKVDMAYKICENSMLVGVAGD